MIRRVAFSTLIYFIVFYAADNLFFTSDKYPSNFSIVAIAFFLSSWPMTGIFRFEGATVVLAERLRLIAVATAFWLAIGGIDWLGVEHNGTTLTSGVICWAVTVGGNVLRARRRARMQIPHDDPPNPPGKE